MNPQRIVVVEDENIVALDIKLQLEHLGYVVPGVFASGEDLLARLADLSADLVLLDIILKGRMDGVETAKRVKEDFDLPVILLTALDTQETLERAKLVQPFAFIVKPFDERELRNAVVISLYRHTMERTLQHRERLFSTTLESIQDGVLVTDEEYRIEYSNSVAGTVIGRVGDLRGLELSEVLQLSDAEARPVGLNEKVDGPLRATRPDGSTVVVDRYVSPLVDRDGSRNGWVIVIHDITESLAQEEALRQQEEQLRRSQKMEAIGRLTGGIAHDFNNLLTVILGYAKLLAEETAQLSEADPQTVKADVEGIQKAAVRSAALTRQLLAFSRHQIMERRVIDVNQIVADMEKMLQRLVSDDVRTQVDLLADEPHVRVDPSQLEQVLMNLAVNARDAMPNGGRLAIRTEVRDVGAAQISGHEGLKPGRFVAIVVRDTGVGMSREITERVFEPFFTTKALGQGTGLGLSTVYGIVIQSGGFIELDSLEGRGTTFTVYLPVFDGAGPGRREKEALADTRGGNETILVVEDDDAIRALFARVLRQKGYHVLEAANAGEAVLLNEEHGDQIDLLMTDVVMPHLSGVELAQRLTAEVPGLRVLYVSAHPESYLSNDERRELGRRYVQKPVEPARLAERVRAILDE